MHALVVQAGAALALLFAEPVLIPPVGGEVTGPFTYEPYVGGRAAVTLACEPGELVRAPASGAVAFVGDVAGRTAVTVALNGGWRVTIGLLEPGEVPASVHTGDSLGTCPAAGEVSLSLRHAGAYVDPEPAMRSGRLRLALWLGGPEDRPGGARSAKSSSNRYFAPPKRPVSERGAFERREIVKQSAFRAFRHGSAASSK